MDGVARPDGVAAEMDKLRRERDDALQAARSAVRDASRVNRILTVLSEPAPLEALLEKILTSVSELFAADVVVLMDPVGTGHYYPVASVGLPEDYVFDAAIRDDIALFFETHREGIDLDPEMIRANPIFHELYRMLGVETAAWIPMKGSRTLRGAFILARCTPIPFTREEMDLLTTMAYRIALTLEQIQNTSQLEHVVQANQNIGRQLETSTIEEEATRTFPGIVSADAAVLFRCMENSTIACASIPRKIQTHAPEWSFLGKHLSQDASLLLGEAVSLTNADRIRFPADSADFPYRAVLAAPIFREGRMQGLLCALRCNAVDFTMETKQIASLYAGQIAAAIENAHLYGALRDELRERRSIEASLRESELRFKALVQNISDVIAVLNAQGTFKYVGEAARFVWRRAPEELVGTTLLDRAHPDDRETLSVVITAALEKPGENMRVVVRMREGEADAWRYFDVILTNLLHDASVKGLVSTFHDVTERKMFEKELTELAFRDPLTGLSNRASFFDHVRFALARAAERDTSVAVIFFDLDNFKSVNDNFGHAAGDETLRIVASRIKACLRSEDIAARLGGDEFTILIDNIKDINYLYPILDRLLAALKAPVRLKGTEVHVGGSIGIAMSEPKEDDAESLLHKADLSMYQAKRLGKGRYVVFDHSFEE